ncbi:MAG: ribonuclease III [Anaerolineae bacterium]|nr:ribonuclease III [Anaerolineae bacterium]
MTDPQGSINCEAPEDLAKRLGLAFSDNLLLCRALTHRSYLNEHPEALEDNERLEFLGDAVLDFVVGRWLYNHFPEMNEGEMTRLRAALVKTEQLAEFAIQLDIGPAIRLGRGEGENGGRTRLPMLCAVFEALVGGLCLDAGIDAVEAFVEPLLDEAAEAILAENEDQDPKSQLQERAQSQGYEAPLYMTIEENGPDHEKTFTVEAIIGGNVYGRGSGRSKQVAAKAAAREALKKFHAK